MNFELSKGNNLTIQNISTKKINEIPCSCPVSQMQTFSLCGRKYISVDIGKIKILNNTVLSYKNFI